MPRPKSFLTDPNEVQDEPAVVTGGSRGFDAAIAKRLLVIAADLSIALDNPSSEIGMRLVIPSIHSPYLRPN
jgi:NAD(P)-dependent dehydrogenase (short-subunit alcohol dehydrogenase family)